MPRNAKNGRLKIDGTTMDYIFFGSGSKTLIMIPGLGDGLTTVKGLAVPFSAMYKEFIKDFTVYVFSRKNDLPQEYTSVDMARDQKKAMELLGIKKADILGVSQGGTVAQQMAIEYPEAVGRLVLAVTYAKANDTVREVVGRWISFAENRDYGSLMIDVSECSYSEEYLKKYRSYYPLLKRLGRKKDYSRFITLAKACITHDALDSLGSISCPTLIIGGEQDKIVTADASRELAAKITGSQLYMYPQYGHSAYEEAKDFNSRVAAFLSE